MGEKKDKMDNTESHIFNADCAELGNFRKDGKNIQHGNNYLTMEQTEYCQMNTENTRKDLANTNIFQESPMENS